MENISSLYHQIKPPKDIINFSPCLSECIFHSTIPKHRLIFHSSFLTKFEEIMLKKFESVISHSKLKNSKSLSNCHRNELLKFLYSKNWDIPKALKSLDDYLKWRDNHISYDLNYLSQDIQELLETGCFYTHGRDKQFHPIIVIRTDQIDCYKYTIDQYLKAAYFFLEFIIKSLLVPGKVESWILLTDMNKKGLGNIPYGALKKVMEILEDNYTCRLTYNFILNPPQSIKMIWNILKHFLPTITQQKTYLSSTSHSLQLLDIVHSSQIEAKYGGSSSNLEKYWPPLHMISTEENQHTVYHSFDDCYLRSLPQKEYHKRVESSPCELSRGGYYYDIVVEELDSADYLLENIPSEDHCINLRVRKEATSSVVSNHDKNTSQVEFIASFISSWDIKENDYGALSSITNEPKLQSESISIERELEIEELYSDMTMEKESTNVSCFSFRCCSLKKEEETSSCSLL